ncbi:hypothetical protein [Clostridium sp. DJ247]|uniref:hypothetical protein n=1 Tax=Clostridium sp. DJ247 TaxID=2726188 RepID=UPI0016250977|nr:hypothetical protein [Clostridium sp. DJ247]MBC2579999.1 hypothetical protein [Clostridium sp. DJ247]
MMIPCKVEIYKKIDENNIFTGYESTPYTFTRLIESVNIDRRLSSNVATANIDMFYSGFNEDLVLYQYGGWGDKIPILDNFNKIKIYIDNKVQFYGVIINYSIDDEKAVVHLSCQDMFYHLNRLVDCRVPYIEYSNILVYDLLTDLAAKAGIPTTTVMTERGENYLVNNIKIKYDTQVSDVFADATATSNTRVRCLKTGELAIEDIYHTYEYSDVSSNINYDFEYTYTKKIAFSEAKRGGDTLYNRLLVRFDDKTYNVYDNPTLFNYMCAENKFKEIQTTLGDTQEKRFRLANRAFRNDTRETTTLILNSVEGNPNLDLGQALRVNLDSRIGHYMVVGISTSYSAEGYFDTIDIEGLLPTNYISCEISTGNYENTDESSGTNEHFVDIEAGISKNIIINKSRANKMAKFNTTAGMSQVVITCTFDNSNASASLVAPSGYIIGLESNPSATDGTQLLTSPHGTINLTNVTVKDLMATQISFTDYPGLTQIIKIDNPMKGTWVIRGVGVPTEDVGCTITANIKWTMLNEDADVKSYTTS